MTFGINSGERGFEQEGKQLVAVTAMGHATGGLDLSRRECRCILNPI